MTRICIHCCRLQAVYSPITVKSFVTLYTGFNPCKKGNLILRLQEMLFEVQIFLTSLVHFVQGSITSTKYFVANCTGNSSTYTFVTKFFGVNIYKCSHYFPNMKTSSKPLHECLFWPIRSLFRAWSWSDHDPWAII